MRFLSFDINLNLDKSFCGIAPSLLLSSFPFDHTDGKWKWKLIENKLLKSKDLMSSVTLIALYKFLANQSMCHSMFSLILSDWLLSKWMCILNNVFEFCELYLWIIVLMHLMAIDIRMLCLYFGSIFCCHMYHFPTFFCRSSVFHAFSLYLLLPHSEMMSIWYIFQSNIFQRIRGFVPNLSFSSMTQILLFFFSSNIYEFFYNITQTQANVTVQFTKFTTFRKKATKLLTFRQFYLISNCIPNWILRN